MCEPLRVVAFSGSDSSGCAGLQADLGTLQKLGIHGLSVVTAITAQTAAEVKTLAPTRNSLVKSQFETALEVGFQAGKTGLLPSNGTIELVARLWESCPEIPLVVDPVRTSSSGKRFLSWQARHSFRHTLFPKATLVTPNLPEAEWLLQKQLHDRESLVEAAEELQSWGPAAVLIKGGHGDSTKKVSDLLYVNGHCHWLEGPRLAKLDLRGTGCVLSSSIAGFMALGLTLIEAVKKGREVVQEGIEHGYSLAGRAGPCSRLNRL